MKKKIVSLLILFVLALMVTCVNADPSSDCTEAVATLGSIGDFDLSSDYGSEVTKEAALKFVIDVFGTGTPQNSADVSVFSDIAKGADMYKIVSEAYWLGIVDPDDGFSFSPSAPITVDEFSRMIVRAAGYDFKAVKYNYSLIGYTRLAKELDILYESYITEDGILTYGNMYNMVYNTLFADSVVTYDANGKRETYVNKGVTVLENLFGLKSFEGVYFGNEYSAFYGNYSFRNKEFGVSDDNGAVRYFRADFESTQYLGYRVKVFYCNSKGYDTAVAIVKYNNREFVIDGDEFSDYDPGTRTFNYTLDQRIDSTTSKKVPKTLKISNSDINMIYNGQFVSDAAPVLEFINNCSPENGYSVDRIVFADNDGDSGYETVIIETFRDLYAYYINNETKTVADDYGDMFKFDFDSDNKYIIKSDDGSETTFDKITDGSVLRIKEGLGTPHLITVVVTSNTVVARFESQTIEDDHTTAVVVFGEVTAKGDQYVGSFVGGLDGDLPKAMYRISNSFERHIGDVLVTPYTFYTVSFNCDGEISGCRMYIFDSNVGYNLPKLPFGINAYDSTGYGVILSAAKSSSLRQDIRIKIFDMPHEIRFYAVHDYELSDDVQVKNIKECWFWIENPEEFFVREDDGTVMDEKVELFNRLKAEYEQYGDDIKKYSLDVLRFMLSYKFVTYRFDTDMKICEIKLPGFGVRNGDVSYNSVPGKTYYKSSSAYYSLYDGKMYTLPGNTINIMVPDPDCSYAERYDLCQNIFESGSLQIDGTYKMDFYTFDKNTSESQVSVRYMNYDTISPKGGTEVSGVVLRKSKGATPSGYIADNYYVFNASMLDWGARRMYSVYPATYMSPSDENGKLSDKKYRYVNSASGLNNFTEYNINLADIDESKKYADIEPGDIVTFTYPSNKSSARASEPFSCVSVIYDKSKDKMKGSVSNSLTNLGDIKYVKGRIYDISDTAVAFLPSFYYENAGDYEYSRKDCTILIPSMIEIVLCEKLPDGTYSATKGEYADLYESKNMGYTIVANIYTRSMSTSATTSKFWIYKE